MDVRFRSVTYPAIPNASPHDMDGLFSGLLLAGEVPAPSTQAYDGDAELTVKIGLTDISAEGLDAVLYTDQLVISGARTHDWPSGGMPADGMLTIVLPRGTDG